MKKFGVLLVMSFLFSLIIVATTGPAQAFVYPTADGKDVLVPEELINTIPGETTVYAATDSNGWFVRGSEWATENNKKKTEMVKEGDVYRAKGMFGQRFHPVRLAATGQPIWAKIENIYPLPPKGGKSKFIDYTDPNGPCLLVE